MQRNYSEARCYKVFAKQMREVATLNFLLFLSPLSFSQYLLPVHYILHSLLETRMQQKWKRASCFKQLFMTFFPSFFQLPNSNIRGSTGSFCFSFFLLIKQLLYSAYEFELRNIFHFHDLFFMPTVLTVALFEPLLFPGLPYYSFQSDASFNILSLTTPSHTEL